MYNIPDTDYVFISYSRNDSEFAQRLVGDLENNNVKTWVDTKNIPDTVPDWEEGVRKAINRATAFILIATPNSLNSNPVFGEKLLARKRNPPCPIYFVWAKGDEWIDAISITESKASYIDFRGNKYETGLTRLLQNLQPIIIADQIISDTYENETPEQLQARYLIELMRGLRETYTEYELYLSEFGYNLGDQNRHTAIISKAIGICLAASDTVDCEKCLNILAHHNGFVECAERCKDRLAYIATLRLTPNFVEPPNSNNYKSIGEQQLAEIERWGTYQDRNRNALNEAVIRFAELIADSS